MTYTDSTPMPYGKYKGTPLIDVPAEHLIWLHTETKMRDEDLKFYIEDNMNVLLKETEQPRR
jgi:uncharacterized protein (DUF3820 family)